MPKIIEHGNLQARLRAFHACRVYWGSHGCSLPRGHEVLGISHICWDCFDPQDLDGYVGAPPYYGPSTLFYGKDAERLGLPLQDLGDIDARD